MTDSIVFREGHVAHEFPQPLQKETSLGKSLTTLRLLFRYGRVSNPRSSIWKNPGVPLRHCLVGTI
ncbi:hypothetical protein R6Q59_024869 [Mikania micrantha]